eukprot:11175552-Alexandrium_andersonii.AAC.1
MRWGTEPPSVPSRAAKAPASRARSRLRNLRRSPLPVPVRTGASLWASWRSTRSTCALTSAPSLRTSASTISPTSSSSTRRASSSSTTPTSV